VSHLQTSRSAPSSFLSLGRATAPATAPAPDRSGACAGPGRTAATAGSCWERSALGGRRRGRPAQAQEATRSRPAGCRWDTRNGDRAGFVRLARDPATALIASVLAGLSWIAVLATLNVSAQVALPSWVRDAGSRCLRSFCFGSMSAGSALFGPSGHLFGLPVAHFIAAAALLAALPLALGLEAPDRRRRGYVAVAFTGPRQC